MGILPLFLLAVFVYFIFRMRRSGKQKISTDHVPETFIVFDLETTGLDADKHEIIEVAAIKFQKGTTTHQTFQSLVRPNKKIPKKITEITGITQEMVNNEGKLIQEILLEFSAFIGELRLVSFNSEFDMAFLQASAKNANLPQFNNPVSCALKMARRAWPRRRSYRLVDLASDGQFDEGKAHRALEDARRALIVYAAAASELKSAV